MPVLNITNGDGAANILELSAVQGHVLPWRDPMHHGPVPAGLDLDEVSDVRARYLAETDLALADVARDFRRRNDRLRAALSDDGVVLWFEHDLLDQLQILQLLDWFSTADLGETSLDLLCIDHYPGVDSFRGIGELDATQMASLFDWRQAVTREQLDLATQGWTAFRSPDPLDLVAFMARDLNALPFLQAALARHLEEYPSMRSGLTRSEQQILRLVSEGVCTPGQIFVHNMALETALFIGDWPTFSIITELCSCACPLLHCDPGGTFRFRPQVGASDASFRNQRLRLTEASEQVLAGHCDAFDFIERDHWLGGVHLESDQPMWVWDTANGRLQLRDSRC